MSRTSNEFLIEDDGSISTLYYGSYMYDSSMNEKPTTTYVYIRCGKDIYEFITAEAAIGTDFTSKPIEKDMSKEKAIKMFEDLGATVKHNGGIADGVYYH